MVVLSNPVTKEDNQDSDEWALIVCRVSNGYVLKGRSEMGISMQTVIEDDDADELKSHEQLLWEIMEYFSFTGSKHDAERIRITREKRKP
jgi:hypothetical protein